MKPKLSVVIPAFSGGFPAVAAAVDAWEAQTRRSELEILVFCPESHGATPAPPPGLLVIDTGSAPLHEARAMAIHRASGDYIVFAEDHCLPDPDWADAVLHRIEEGWDVIGAVMRLGNQRSSWTEAGLLLGNGEWLDPVASGPVRILGGLNVTIRARLLHDLGKTLADELTFPPYFVRRLSEQGRRFYLEGRARMRHFEPPDFAAQCGVYWSVGAAFGLFRTRKWPRPARFLYALAAPLIALLHGKRAFVQYVRHRKPAGLRLDALLAAFVLSCWWALSEAVGAIMPSDWTVRQIWRDEVRPVRKKDAEDSAERERRSATDSPVMVGVERH